MFNYEYPPLGGGGGVVHQHIAEEMARRHRVTVLTTGCEGLAPAETVGGVDIRRVNVIGRNAQATASLISMLSFYPASLRAGQKAINEIKPDLINTHFAIPTGPSVVKLARRNQIPHALCIHGGDIFDPSKRLSPHRIPPLRHTVRRVLHGVDRVLAQSQNTAENARTIYGYEKAIDIIPHGLKKPDLPEFSRKALGLSEDQIVLVTVGRLVARKANHQLVRMVSRMNNPRVVLVLLGDGPERDSLRETAVQLGIERQVLMPGFVSEECKYQFLQAADLFVSSTSHEGFGLMYVEAMFCRLPIITYDHGGQSDFLRDGKTGYLIRLNDEAALQQATERLVGEPDLRRKMGDFNVALAEEFTIGRCAARYERIFEDMISDRR
jgi:glycosyltransferase involved in cell wall biosynthesis